MAKKPDEDDSLLLGNYRSQRRVDYSSKEVRDVGQVVCKHCYALDGAHDPSCQKNN